MSGWRYQAVSQIECHAQKRELLGWNHLGGVIFIFCGICNHRNSVAIVNKQHIVPINTGFVSDCAENRKVCLVCQILRLRIDEHYTGLRSVIIGNIEKSILKSELGLTPLNDGKIIRISIPPLTEERRKELAKLAKKMAEEGKVAIRNHRREANEMFKELKKEKEISEDYFHKCHDDVQKITDEFIKKAEEITAQKEKEIIEF
jgi:hypothetical protein